MQKKNLKKLTINKMADFQKINNLEQMELKGGNPGLNALITWLLSFTAPSDNSTNLNGDNATVNNVSTWFSHNKMTFQGEKVTPNYTTETVTFTVGDSARYVSTGEIMLYSGSTITVTRK